MIINLGNKKYIAITVIKSSQNEDLYEYYMGDTKIGVLNPKVMEDNILILENTLENELAGQIRDCINNISREDIEEDVLSQEDALKNVKDVRMGHVHVPKVVK